MEQGSPFVITPFTNPSGEIVFRVTGWPDGKRIRRNFPTRAEAEAERQVLIVQSLQGEAGPCPPFRSSRSVCSPTSGPACAPVKSSGSNPRM
ncbi:hypothetical protein OPIT5_08820 [Opitutaceae bacterium TAV5]|nr:hypothetical protein OPIT5_08820 [Opitutaceae bacterium TAV5]